MNRLFSWRRFPLMLLAGLLILGIASGIAAQGNQCPALVKQALADLGQNCDSLDRNSACYGFNRVNATFFQDVAEDFFSAPADRTGISALETIATAPLDVNNEFWGIAVLNVQANIPNTLPGQAVTFILLGDVAVDNAVDPAKIAEPVAPVDITTVIGANVRSSPSTRANVIGSAARGATFAADGLSQDQRWVRIVYQSGTGWLSREVIRPAGDLSSLPVISAEARAPMQAFFFRTAVGDPQCNEAPSLLVIQGPKNVKVNLNANGADITIGSTIVLRLLPGGIVELIVIDGEARLGDLVVPAGFSVRARLGEDGAIVGGWTDFSPLTSEEIDLLLTLEDIPSNILHYPIRIPTLAEILAAIQALSGRDNSNGSGSNTPAITGVDCRGFRGTSPLDGLAFGPTTFYWDPAAGATSYRLNLYNESGALVSSVETGGPATSVVADTSGLGTGFRFGWDVTALVNGQVACTTGRVTLLREAPPAPVVKTPEPISTPEVGFCNFNEICEPGEDPFSCPSDCGFYGT